MAELTLEATKAQVAKIHVALVQVETFYGTGARMKLLHQTLADGLAMLADHFGVDTATISPDGGGGKPPK